jgi:hypothetical protein
MMSFRFFRAPVMTFKSLRIALHYKKVCIRAGSDDSKFSTSAESSASVHVADE